MTLFAYPKVDHQGFRYLTPTSFSAHMQGCHRVCNSIDCISGNVLWRGNILPGPCGYHMLLYFLTVPGDPVLTYTCLEKVPMYANGRWYTNVQKQTFS